jgi:hypothetical protein
MSMIGLIGGQLDSVEVNRLLETAGGVCRAKDTEKLS